MCLWCLHQTLWSWNRPGSASLWSPAAARATAVPSAQAAWSVCMCLIICLRGLSFFFQDFQRISFCYLYIQIAFCIPSHRKKDKKKCLFLEIALYIVQQHNGETIIHQEYALHPFSIQVTDSCPTGFGAEEEGNEERSSIPYFLRHFFTFLWANHVGIGTPINDLCRIVKSPFWSLMAWL